jgi:release factor glutamine methyltransferase
MTSPTQVAAGERLSGEPTVSGRPLSSLPRTSCRTVSVAEALRASADRLQHIADNPRLEARILLAHALGSAPADLVREPGKQVDTGELERLLERREAREPVAMILGRREFWSMDFLVSGATLIPRPESETLIEAALTVFAARPPPIRILDVGTGTGCLLLALLREFPGAFGVGADISADATQLAQCNAMRLGLAERSAFVCADWTNALCGEFDLIVSNPPYVATSDITLLMPEVAIYEPRRALDGGLDGYDAYRMILPRVGAILKADGTAILEVGAAQAGVVSELAREHGFAASSRSDLAGIERVIVLARRTL